MRPTDAALDKAVELVSQAEKIAIHGGEGTRDARDEVLRLSRHPAGAGVVRLPRQGRARGRQPGRRRDDRPARLGRRDRGARRLRPAVHARHRLPVPRIPAGREDDHPGRRQAAAPRPPGRGRPRARRRRRRDAAGADPQARSSARDTHFLDHVVKHHHQMVKGIQTYVEPRGQRPRAAARDGRRRAQRPRRGRRGLHRRHRHVQRVGRALPADEARPPDPRVVQPRLDGQRDAAGDRREDRLARPPGGRAVRRRRLLDADGRAAHGGGARHPGQADDLQQLDARHGPRGDDGRRATSRGAPT